MKKSLLVLAIFLGIQLVGQAQQWTTTGTHLSNSNIGSVGIGLVPTGNYKFEILDANGATLGLYRNAATANWGTSITFDLNNSSGTRVSYGLITASISSPTAGTHNGFMSFQVATNGLLQNAYQQEKMRILSNGNVGIGTTTPNAQLQLGNTVTNRKLVLYETANNDQQYFGFGINSNTLRFQIPLPTTAYRFYRGNDASTSAEIFTVLGNGNVGIGNSNPFNGLNNAGLQIGKGDHSTLLLADPINGSNGGVVQTSDNKHRVFIGANLYDDPTNSWQNFQLNKGGAGISVLADKGAWGSQIDFYATDNNGIPSASNMVIKSSGSVGIGTGLTTNPNNYKLAVNGTIGAKAVKVETSSSTWADYVFLPTYRLRPLTEVEGYIQANQHLPEVPSATEVEKNGINLGEMDALLLKKIEELTLYMIEQNKKLEAQNQKIQALEKQLAEAKK